MDQCGSLECPCHFGNIPYALLLVYPHFDSSCSFILLPLPLFIAQIPSSLQGAIFGGPFAHLGEINISHCSVSSFLLVHFHFSFLLLSCSAFIVYFWLDLTYKHPYQSIPVLKYTNLCPRVQSKEHLIALPPSPTPVHSFIQKHSETPLFQLFDFGKVLPTLFLLFLTICVCISQPTLCLEHLQVHTSLATSIQVPLTIPAPNGHRKCP